MPYQSVFTPFHPPATTTFPPLQTSSTPQKVKLPMRSQIWHFILFWGLTKVLLSISKMSKVSLQIEWAPKKSVQSLAVSPFPTASDLTEYPSHATGTHIQMVLLCSIQVTPLSIWTQRASTSSSSYGYPQNDLNPFAYTIVPPLFPLYSQTSFQCWAVYLCICFHQLLNEQWQLR